MSITPVSPSSPASTGNQYADLRTDFRQLTTAIQSGDLSSAQAAYSAIQQSGVSLPQNSPISQDLSAIGQALQSGNISSAQQALSTLQTDAQSAAQAHHGHRHHHHHSSSTSSTTPPDPTQTTGVNLEVTA